MSREVEAIDQQHMTIMASNREDNAIEIGTGATVITITGDIEHFAARIQDAVRMATTSVVADDTRDCSRCGDEVGILNSQDECAGCEEERAKNLVCKECDETINVSDPSEPGYRFRDGSIMCASCTHDAFRSGWEGEDGDE